MVLKIVTLPIACCVLFCTHAVAQDASWISSAAETVMRVDVDALKSDFLWSQFMSDPDSAAIREAAARFGVDIDKNVNTIVGYSLAPKNGNSAEPVFFVKGNFNVSAVEAKFKAADNVTCGTSCGVKVFQLAGLALPDIIPGAGGESQVAYAAFPSKNVIALCGRARGLAVAMNVIAGKSPALSAESKFKTALIHGCPFKLVSEADDFFNGSDGFFGVSAPHQFVATVTDKINTSPVFNADCSYPDEYKAAAAYRTLCKIQVIYTMPIFSKMAKMADLSTVLANTVFDRTGHSVIVTVHLTPQVVTSLLRMKRDGVTLGFDPMGAVNGFLRQ